MLMRTKLLSARRFAAGIDVSPQEVRLVIVSRVGRGARPVRVEWLGAVPLAAGAMSGAHLVDRAAVAAALSSLRAQWPRRCAMRGMPCAMAIPGGATAMATLELAAHRSPERAPGCAPESFDELEPIMLDEAERLCGVERDALAVDWWADGGGPVRCGRSAGGTGGAPPRVTLAATPRQHLEARVEVAAMAGIALAAVDGEPLAALRALAYAAEHEPRPSERYAAVWAGYDGVYGWRIAENAVEFSMHYPGSEHADLDSALRRLVACEPLDRALVGGAPRLFERVGLTLADVGERLGCSAAQFECSPFCSGAGLLAAPGKWRHAPSFAVAFGLALRGVCE